MTTPNEELRARKIADAEAAMQACYMDHADNRLTTTLLHDMATAAVAALARQEEGREAVVWQYREVRHPSGALLPPDEIGPWQYADEVRRREIESLPQEKCRFELRHPAPHSGGEGDAMRTLLQEVLDECAGMECFPCEGSMAPFEDLCGRIARTLATPTPQAAGDRMRQWAQGLIQQLPPDHDGRNSWLLNYGVGEESDWLRSEHARYKQAWKDWREGQPQPTREPNPFRNATESGYASTTAGQQAAGVSEEIVERAMDAFCDEPGSWLRDSMRAALEAVWPTAAGAAPEGCIRVSRVLAETAAIVAAEWLDLFAETPGLEKYERYTYGPQVEVLRDDLKAALAPAQEPAGGGEVAPWPDFAGNPIRDRDRIRHPDGTTGTVLHLPALGQGGEAWRVVYEHGDISRLSLQIGEKGQAVVATPTPQAAGVSEDAALDAYCAAWCKSVESHDGVIASFDDEADREHARAGVRAVLAMARVLHAAGQQAAGVSELVPSWRDRADRSIPDGPDSKWHEGARDGMLQCAAELERALTAAGAAPEGWPARYACNGPEGTFWTDDAVLANRLLLHDTAIERDEWTVTDTQQPGAQHGQEGRDG